MLYFIPWVIFLLVVVLAVPVVSWLEKRKHAPPKEAESEDEFAEDEAEEESAEAESEDGATDFPQEEPEMEVEVQGGDDFSAFDDIK